MNRNLHPVIPVSFNPRMKVLSGGYSIDAIEEKLALDEHTLILAKVLTRACYSCMNLDCTLDRKTEIDASFEACELYKNNEFEDHTKTLKKKRIYTLKQR